MQHHARIRGNVHSSDDRGCCGRSEQPLRGGFVAQDFFNHCLHHLRIGTQLLERLGVILQEPDRVADRPCDRDVPCDDDIDHHAHRLHVGQWLLPRQSDAAQLPNKRCRIIGVRRNHDRHEIALKVDDVVRISN